MAKKLVIVESPAKARTIGRILGSNYTIKASVGHVRDLPKSQLGVDVEHDFNPKYLVPREKKAVIKDLKAAAKDASSLYLATDPDREGEAIAWHLVQAINADGLKVQRVVFHEITPEAIKAAFAEPRQINAELVNAQQTRRILDRLVGYMISPLLWRKVRGRLSAGRVQSVAVRMIVEREREIEAFVPQEYWSIKANLSKQPLPGKKSTKRDVFTAALVGRSGEKEKLEIPNEAVARKLEAALQNAGYSIADVRQKETLRQPSAPFTTSTLQQEAYRKLRFTAKRTMAVAQQLYEGLSVGTGGSVGLITYMRTDSTHVAASAQSEARSYIRERFGSDFVPGSPRFFTRKSKGAQEAHEAIRPTSVHREPAALAGRLTPEQLKLYELIWKRFVASQMEAARIDTMTVDVRADDAASGQAFLLRASGSAVKFEGFLALYSEGRDEGDAEDERHIALPLLTKGEVVDLLKLLPEQHFTAPPPRYTEASLVKALEEQGIGRPSTYAPTISTVLERGYVEKVERHLRPTELGCVVTDLLAEHFPDIINTGFTARMESELDEIAGGKASWVPVLREFYNPFSVAVERAAALMPERKIADEPAGENCELCGRPMVIKYGRYGKFVACSGFPECRKSKPFLTKIGVSCPKCGADIVQRKTKGRRMFYGCSQYPQCDFTSWDKPVAQRCQQCGGLMTARGRREAKCSDCGMVVPLSDAPRVELSA
ncbi:MAG: type I DNA topoisomerase [Chloroflexota bacterium]|nr:MAG: type I DNA topoisomerase [Chloroflexota bacterium]